jgi:hypothetical protein
MTRAELDAIRAVMIEPLLERLNAAEARIAILEARPIGATDAGLFVAGKSYQAGDGVTWDHHFWVCQRPTTEGPGNGCPAWRLAVSRGKTGREGKRGAMGPPGPPCQCAELRASS